MTRGSPAIWAAFLVLFGILLGGGTPARAVEAEDAPYVLTPVATGLDHPWGIAFLPNGDALVTEKAGRLRLIADGALVPQPVPGPPEVFNKSQGGLLDVVLHPGFASNGLVYLSYAKGTGSANALAVARGRLEGRTLADVETIFTARPTKDTPVHYGGRMAFLGDGTLLVTLGDGFVYREEAQRLTSHLGTIVRLNDDGTVPQDNPFRGQTGALPEIYSYGHRNVQGIVYDPLSGHVFACEHGPKGGDELNLIRPGKNYGWPIATYGVDYTGQKISPFTEYEGTEQPLVWWVPSIAPAALTIYTGDAFPDWTGDIFVAALIAGNGEPDVTTGHVRRIAMENGMPAETGPDETSELLFGELEERVRDVATGADGTLYLLTEGPKGARQPAGRVWRVAPRN